MIRRETEAREDLARVFAHASRRRLRIGKRMRVILSRKGFDSSAGGHPSPILLDDTLLSFPIPERLPGRGVRYRDMRAPSGASYYEVMTQLGIQRVRAPHLGETRWVSLTPDIEGHLDPDLRSETRERDAGWRPALGLAGPAQRALEKLAPPIQDGDLFLFFGWFAQTDAGGGGFKRPRRGVHAIWGYLQVERVLRVTGNKHDLPAWLAAHPHVLVPKRGNDTVYISRPRLTLGGLERLPGAGPLRYTDATRLTASGERRRSIWRLPKCFHPKYTAITRLPEKIGNRDRFHDEGEAVRVETGGYGQEFVISENDDVLAWARDVIASSLADDDKPRTA